MKINFRNLVLKYWLIFMFSIMSLVVHAQKSTSKTNTPYLKNLSVELDKIYQEYKESVEIFAFERDVLLREVLDNGSTVKLIRILPSGIPEYYKTFNFRASQNVGTTKLRPRADLSLNLTGKNMFIGIWDSGSTNVEHQEFGERVEIKDNIPFDDHGTHVAGTIAAAGVNSQAKGMAYEANIIAYEFSNDNSEMAAEAAEGLIISNHSYGLRTGWDVTSGGTGWQWFGDPSISNVEDYRFGYYDASNSKVWDDIAFNAPFYLIVKSAGNDRTDVGDGTRPPDGPYDCIGAKSVAKNILTIGAVEHLDGDYTGPEDVVMGDFSSWGPTDDGRVKPDISAIGVDVFSTLSGGVDVYGMLSGTSMSAPNTTGSLALLQEYHAQLYSGTYMRSATLKGLVIHTANEAGKNPGPDYEFGWGLLAVDKAANMLTRNDGKDYIVDELNLQENDSMVVMVSSDGTAPLVATICWTDVPGNPAPISLNPTDLMLINDLDIRIYDENNIEFMPWILDPTSPDKGASFGDNFRDNVEKIEISTPAPGEYKIVIKHKNTLRNNNQDFSLLVSTSSLDLSLTNFYWIGNSGDWNDPTNWSLSSGGNVAGGIPQISNPVIFDNNSFNNPVNTINFSSSATCYNINYYATDSCNIDLASFSLNVDGGIFNENNKVSFQNGKISFKGIISKNNQILAGPTAFNTVDMEFISTNGSWNIVNDFSAKNINIENSSLFAANKSINLSSLVITATTKNEVNFSSSTLNGLDFINISVGTAVDFDNSTIIFSNENGNTSKSILASGNSFHNIIVEQIDLTMTGNNTINKLVIDGSLSLIGDNTIDSLRLSDISSLSLSENSTQTINKQFEATGSVNNPIEITSSGIANASIISDDSNIRFCFDYLNVTNVSVSGSTGFLSGDNSTINANSTGWIEVNCDDALFPSFDVKFPCALGEVRFEDTSTGFPTEWNWNFGNLQFPQENNSSSQDPFHNYRFEGDYEVTFNVRNNQFDKTITRTITIINFESGLGVPSININGTRLTSSMISPNYQWYFNNSPIPGASERIYEIANPGLYYVTVFDDNCLFRSESTIVTSIERESLQNDFTIYPNPSSGMITFNVINNFYGQIGVKVYNVIGINILDLEYKKDADSIEKQFSLQDFPTGIYSIIVNMNGKTSTKKIVLTR